MNSFQRWMKPFLSGWARDPEQKSLLDDDVFCPACEAIAERVSSTTYRCPHCDWVLHKAPPPQR